jgi:hypothetical protein
VENRRLIEPVVEGPPGAEKKIINVRGYAFVTHWLKSNAFAADDA